MDSIFCRVEGDSPREKLLWAELEDLQEAESIDQLVDEWSAGKELFLTQHDRDIRISCTHKRKKVKRHR